MAIQQVGGQGVYVITGSGRDPRRTSNGQSWADLVTKQKYMLYKSAYDQAMREYESGQISAKERAKRIEGMRDQILREQRDITKAQDQLRRQQLRGEERKRELEYREKGREKGRGSSRSKGTRSYRGVKQEIPTKRQMIATLNDRIDTISGSNKDLENSLRRLEDSIVQGKVKRQSQNGLFEFIADPATTQQVSYNTNVQTIKDNNKAIQNLRSDINLLNTYQDNDKYLEWYRANELPTIEFTGATEGTEGTEGTDDSSKPIGYVSSVDYSAAQDELAARKKALDLELEALKTEEADVDPVNVLDRTSEIYDERYANKRPRRKLFGRRAEMEALGMEPEVEPQPEEVDVVAEEVAKGEVVDRPITAPTSLRYTVKEGDTLGGIAEQYYGEPARFTDIAQASGIDDPNRIEVGQQLTIPQDQPQMPSAPAEEPMMEEVVEEQTIAPIQPKPAQNEIGDALRQEVMERQAREEEMRRNQQLPEVTPDSLSPTPVQSPMPTQTGVVRLGKMSTFKESMADVPVDPVTKSFEEIRNQSPKDKQAMAMHLIAQAKDAFGVSSQEFKRAKQRILDTMVKSIDPKQARNLKRVKSLQENNPGLYHKLGDDIRGLSQDTKNFVASLFAVNNETKVQEVDALYKNAQQQIKLSQALDKTQKRKAMDMLELMYLAVIEDKR